MEKYLSCDKSSIQRLTDQARCDYEHDKTLAKHDVHGILKYLRMTPANDRLNILYLIDSICINLPHFIPYFEKHIIGIVEMTFRHASKETKLSIC